MQKYKILYAEDDETIGFLTKDNLDQNYEVSLCTNGENALEEFKKNHFDILVSSKKEAVEWGVREIPARICATKKK